MPGSDAPDTQTYTAIQPLYIGAAAVRDSDNAVRIGIIVHGGIHAMDFCISPLTIRDVEDMRHIVGRYVRTTIQGYAMKHHARFVGAGVTVGLEDICLGICPSLGREMDIVAMKLGMETTASGASKNVGTIPIGVGELADSAVRECFRWFDPNHNPALTFSIRSQVLADAEGATKLAENLEEYQNTVHKSTWNTVLKYGYQLGGYRNGRTEGGGVALMRHALVRFCSELGVELHWYILKLNPEAFRIIKANHDILQGTLLNEWIGDNAKLHWLSSGGPLAPGGADVVTIDDPQKPALIPLIKKVRPEVKIIYRSHIEIRSDLVERPRSPQEQVWQWIWNCVKKADIFISHPMDKLVPNGVPLAIVGLMPTCTDWLDGLYKPLGEAYLRFYHDNLWNSCNELKMSKLLYPEWEYITQIARFNPSKGIPEAIESYHKLCIRINRDVPEMLPPQLLLYVELSFVLKEPLLGQVCTDELLVVKPKYAEIAKDVVVMRIGPSDQMLNASLTTSKLVVQLSLREGLEVKVSEALHHGKPVVATRAGGIPLQIEHGKSGFLVEVGETQSVADHLFDLYTNDNLYTRMSEYAEACLVGGQVLKPHGKWITDMARAEVGQDYEDGEPRLPRRGIDIRGENEIHVGCELDCGVLA
ncbi:trehalose synthase [Tuber indicum]|nr:trehalose synthase [Tuber indicum]